MPAGLGASGWLAICLETVMGTYLPPTTSGTIWVPIISETVKYNETPYYSEQIRQQIVYSERTQGFYFVEGDIVLEFDSNYMPYFFHIGRHNIAKAGVGAPYTYTYTPSQAGSASTAASGNVQRTASITIVRNGIGFGYAGCTLNTIHHELDNGVLKFTLGIMGLSEQEPGGLGSPSWIAPSLMGAASHSVYTDAAGTTPTFADADLTYNGFVADVNFNAAAQNRINAERSAAYISYGMTDAQFTTELDFLDRTDYDNFKNNDRMSVKFESLLGGSDFTAATEAYQIIYYNAAFDAYEMHLSGLANLIMAAVTTRGLVQVGGNPYSIKVKTAVNIT